MPLVSMADKNTEDQELSLDQLKMLLVVLPI